MDSNNKRIAKNTMYMYFRMIVLIIVSLYTIKIVFNTLGVENYGIYNIVGSIVIFFSFLNSGLSTATRRFLTAEIATGTEETRKKTFSSAIVAHIYISLILFVIAETIGLYLVNCILNLPEHRMLAVNVVYQLSVLTAMISVMQSPFSSTIIAYERMSIYAYITIFDVIIKLLVVFILKVVLYDKLIVYGILIVITTFLTFLVFSAYCFRHFSMCNISIVKDVSLIRKMFNYTSWSLIGQASVVATNQGCAILVNYFYDVAVNAAMGISGTITKVVNDFVANFQLAFHPQITKYYVSKEYEELNILVNRTSRYSSYLVLLFMFPICFEASDLLHLWLGDYPQYSVEFCIYTMVSIYFEAITAPLWMVLCSDVDIKRYQLTVSALFFLNVLFSWIFLAMGCVPYVVMIIRTVVNILLIMTRLLFIEKKVPFFSKYRWLYDVFVKSVLLLIIPLLFTYFVSILHIEYMLIRMLVVSVVSLISTSLCVLYFGMSEKERLFVFEKIKEKL